MYRDNIKYESKKIYKKDFSKFLHRVCKIDQFSAQSFCKGNFGWSRNSISAMAHAVNYQEFLMLAQSIAKTPAQFNLPDKCSLSDAMAMCRPRMAQSPYELDLFAKQLAENDMNNLSKQYYENQMSTQSDDVVSKATENE